MTENHDNLKTVVDVATRAAAPHKIEPGKIYALVGPDGKVTELNLDRDEYRDHPRRKQGTIQAHDANAFVAYIKKHGLHETEVWSDEQRTRIVGVINAHLGATDDGVEDYAGWQDHRVLLSVRKTDAWNAWITLNGKWLSQLDFAEHIEDRAIDIMTPSSAEVLELVQHFHATKGVTFDSSKRLSSGETQLVYKEELNAKAGQRGQLEIPAHLELGLIPFQGASAYKVKARFRFRIVDGELRLSYALERPEDILRNAFADVVAVVAGDLERPVLNGWPE